MGTVTGHATFNSGGNNWTGGVVGTATFNDDSCNDYEGQVLGDATFNDFSYNKIDSSGVGGNATFNGSSSNHGTVTGACTLDGGRINGGSCGSIIYYSNGSPRTGVYDGICYNNGSPTNDLDESVTGVCNGIYYLSGQATTLDANGDGTWNDLVYSNGTTRTGFYDGLLYSEGSLLTGTAPNGSCYINGVERTESDSFTFGDYGSTPVTDTNLNTLSNYWLPFTSNYAPCFPDSNDTVTITSPVESGTLTAQNISLQSSFSGGTLNGSVTVGQGGEAAGVMTGGTINGDVTFGVTGWASPSYPILEGGTINGNATFTSGSIFVGGTITGTKTWNGFTGQYSKSGASYDGKYFFGGHLRQPEDGQVGGDYYANGELANGVAGSGQMYFYANGKLIGTYDGSMASNAYGTVTFTTVPDATFSYNGYLNFVLTDIHLSAGATLTTNGTITFNGSSNNYGTVNGGETTFNDSALNIGTITGTVTFNDNSRNYMDGIVGTGNATFNDSSYNFGTVGGNATFNNSSFQYGWVDGNVTLNDSSTLDGTVGGAITDNRIASCNDDCYLEGSSPTYAQGLNLGTKRQGPGGTILTLQYANGSSGFKIWKEDNGNRILNATGLIANGWQKMLVSAGTAFSASDFTAGSNIAGRVCPTHVFLNHVNMTATNRCVYYDEGNTAQTLDADSSTGQEGLDWLTEWDSFSTGQGSASSYYEGNINTCADKGMRLPTVYETTAEQFEDYLPTGDGISPTWAGGTNGVPGVSSSQTWTASASADAPFIYYSWSGSNSGAAYSYAPDPEAEEQGVDDSLSVRCVLPSH